VSVGAVRPTFNPVTGHSLKQLHVSHYVIPVGQVVPVVSIAVSIAAAFLKQKVAPLQELRDKASVFLCPEWCLVPGNLYSSSSLVQPDSQVYPAA